MIYTNTADCMFGFAKNFAAFEEGKVSGNIYVNATRIFVSMVMKLKYLIVLTIISSLSAAPCIIITNCATNVVKPKTNAMMRKVFSLVL